MIVRSISTPDERRRRRTPREWRRGSMRPMMPRHRDLHDVGRVGAEHHQLAMGHVDDAHDAERDREADRDQHEHGAQAEAEEQRLDRGVDRSLRSMRSSALAAAALTAASASTNVPSGDCSTSAASLFRTSEPSRLESVSMAARRAAESVPSRSAIARPVSIAVWTPASVSTPCARGAARRSARRAIAACP